jgi:hypothetical protein
MVIIFAWQMRFRSSAFAVRCERIDDAQAEVYPVPREAGRFNDELRKPGILRAAGGLEPGAGRDRNSEVATYAVIDVAYFCVGGIWAWWSLRARTGTMLLVRMCVFADSWFLGTIATKVHPSHRQTHRKLTDVRACGQRESLQTEDGLPALARPVLEHAKPAPSHDRVLPG